MMLFCGKEIDFAIHSLKDIPSHLHDDIHLAAVSPCLDARDALISSKYRSLEGLPKGAVVGTSSVRRHAQMLSRRPDLVLKELRGNVETRIHKMTTGEYDAVLLAASGVKRVGLENQIQQYLLIQNLRPGQGILAANGPDGNGTEKPQAQTRPTSQRSRPCCCVNSWLAAQGGCSVPLGCYLRK
ncbi:MAG: hydroxymethylbilane synthase [Bdellovibrionota bacterium]